MKSEVITFLGKMEFEHMEEFVFGTRVSSKSEEDKKRGQRFLKGARLSKANRCAGSMTHLLRAKQMSRSMNFTINKKYSTILWECDHKF